MRHEIRFTLQGSSRLAQLEFTSASRARLLNHMSELVRQKATALTCVRRIASCFENHFSSDRVRERPHRLRGFRRIGINMDADSAEVVPEAWLYEGACCRIEWLSGRTQHLVHNWRRSISIAMLFSAVGALGANGGLTPLYGCVFAHFFRRLFSVELDPRSLSTGGNAI